MYRNDSVRFLINGHYTDQLFLTKGVKQGCNLSPLLFALFMNSLGNELNSTGRGIDLGNTNISALFFADDLVLVGKSRSDLDELMKITRNYCANHRLGISEKKSKLMSHDAITGKTTFEGSTKFSPLTLDQVL